MNKNTTFINLQTDFGFKRLFGSKERSAITLRFLNAIFEGRKVITEVQYHNKEKLPNKVDGKRIIYDIYCTTDTDEHFIIEMQQAETTNFSKRILFYTSKAIVDQVKRGENYEFQSVYSIIVTGFDIKVLTGRLERVPQFLLNRGSCISRWINSCR